MVRTPMPTLKDLGAPTLIDRCSSPLGGAAFTLQLDVLVSRLEYESDRQR